MTTETTAREVLEDQFSTGGDRDDLYWGGS